ncbi:hypothetical protein FB567DRAFT_542208 [Paraphoma chrysanthemicola]|uniref:Uncharacterized protein n=1 Tax=Paraphoma chrysanthemicola TaxID=798071 RepID=A0A8K0QQT4_9PLEO|nr:hypothetical protein FB567DRAFT_542208 [Paraphoma chrysanthemicola]
MELPTELRIMIAEFAFYTAEGLCWTWQNYRKGPKVAKLRHRSRFVREQIETLNALSRTCKSLYAEMHTIVFKVNTLVFDCRDMHCARMPRNWLNQTYTPSGILDTVAEALLFFGRNVPLNIQPLFPAARLDLQRLPRVEADVTHFKDFMSNFRGFQFHIRYTDWKLKPLSPRFVKMMQEREEDSESIVSEHDEMRKRVNDYMKEAQKASDFVSAVSEEDRDWRIYPCPIGDLEIPAVFGYLTDDEKRLALDWERLGI